MKKLILVTVFSFICVTQLFGGIKDIYFHVAEEARQLKLIKEPEVFFDTVGGGYDYNTLPDLLFVPVSKLGNIHFPAKMPTNLWLRASITNTSKHKAEAFIYPNAYVDITMYRFNHHKLTDMVNHNFYEVPESKNALRNTLFPITINPGDTIQFLFQSKQLLGTFWLPLILYESSSFVSFYDKEIIEKLPHVSWEYFVLGLMFFQLLYSIVQWNVNRRKEYGFYFMYIVFMTLYLLMRLESNYNQVVFFSYYPVLIIYLINPLNYLAYLMYFKFGRFFLDLKNSMPRLNKAVKIIEWLIVAYIIYLLLNSNVFERSLIKEILSISMAVLLFISSIAFISTAAQMKSRVARFFLAGIAIYTLGAFTNFIIRSFLDSIALKFDSIVIFEVAIVIEVLCLNIALAIKARKNEEDKVASQIKFETELNDLQMKALRSQMNPHFIFNCLNSVQRYILKNDKNNAVQYLQKFASLMRMILDNSEKRMVPLNDEIIMLDLYLHLEALRFDHGMDFNFLISDDIQKEDIMIPSMILQPFVENAILHGLMHKEEKGTIKIEISKQANVLKCLIEDNGIGRERAAEIKSKKSSSHVSKGLGITRARLEHLNKVNNAHNELVVTDLNDAFGNPSGTRVEVFIPYEI